MKIGDVAQVRTAFPDADFWLVRQDSADRVGRPVKEYAADLIGIKVDRTRLDPRYAFYLFEYMVQRGVFRQLATGAITLQHITVEQVKKIPIQFRE